MDHQEHLAHREQLVRLVLQEPTGTLVLLGLLEHPAMLELPGWRELLEPLELPAVQVHPDFRVHPVQLERLDLPDLRAHKVLRDSAGRQEVQVKPVSPDQRVLRVQSDYQAVPDRVDPADQLVRLDQMDPVEPRVRLEQLDLLEHQVVLDPMALQDRQVTQDLVDQQELLVAPDLQVHKDLLETRDPRELRVIQVIKEHQDQTEQLARQVLMDYREL